MLRFLHVADLHLDSPLRGLEAYEGCPAERFRGATRHAVANLVAFAVEERLDAVVIAGDLYDGDWTDYRTGLWIGRQFRILHDAGIPVTMIAGNHDAANRMTRTLDLPPSCVMLPADRPGTRVLEAIGLAIHGQGFATQAVTEDLSANYPPPLPGLVNVGLLHTAGEDAGDHDRYAPCSVKSLAAHGYDYWGLGHIHKRAELRAGPPIVFPGNTQGRHARETGAKGGYLVEVPRVGAEPRLEFRRFDAVAWERAEVDLAGLEHPADLLAAADQALRAATLLHDPRPVALRVELVGATPLHGDLLADPLQWTSQVRNLAPPGAWVEKVRFRTQPPRTATGGLTADFAASLAEAAADPETLARLRAELDVLRQVLPPELRVGEDGLRSHEDAFLAELLGQAGTLLARRLTGPEATA